MQVSKQFQGKLRTPGYQHSYTKEEITEILKCQKDPFYFIENYFYINSKDDGTVLLTLRPFQRRLIQSFIDNRYTIGKVGRQMGKSEAVRAYACWCILFKTNYTIGLLSDKLSGAKELISRLKFSFSLLPIWMQQAPIEFNKESVLLENNSRIVISATTGDSFRGWALDMVITDEFAHIPQEDAEDFFASIWPTISSGKSTKLIIISTPKGLNKFWSLYNDAVNGNNKFKVIEGHYSEVRSEEWAKEQRQVMGKVKFAQDVLCEFLGSSNTLIDGSFLAQMSPSIPIKEDGRLKIYKNPDKERNYVVSGDVAQGLNQDYSAMIVFDVTEYPITIAATYRDNTISPVAFAEVLVQVAKSYNNCFILVENNSIGLTVVTTIHRELNYPNLLSESFYGDPGFNTNRLTKRIGCSALKDLVENQKLLINCVDVINELSTFVQQKSSFAAQQGCFDDFCMTCVIFAFLTTTDEFLNINDMNFRKIILERYEKALQEQLGALGLYTSGTMEIEFSEKESAEEEKWRKFIFE